MTIKNKLSDYVFCKKKFNHRGSIGYREDLTVLLCGVGFFGIGKYKARTSVHNRWSSLIHRCYDKSNPHYLRTGAIGVKIESTWFNFQDFAEWYYLECAKLNLDPDRNSHHIVKPKDSLFFGPSVCFLALRCIPTSKKWSFTATDGQQVEVTNLKKYCFDNNLSYRAMLSVASRNI